jgi:hypothetical protein
LSIYRTLLSWLTGLITRPNSLILVLIFVGGLLGVRFLSSPGLVQAESDRHRTLVIVGPEGNIDLAANAVTAAGGRVLHFFPPDAFIADVPANSLPIAGTSAYFTDLVSEAGLAELTPTAQQAARLWNLLLSRPTQNNQNIAGLENIHHDTGSDAFLAPPPENLLNATSNSASPDYYETSEYLLGKVAVGIVLPESNGSLDPSSEDWTVQERAHVISHVVEALDWWAEREARARVSFVYDNLAGTTAPTAVEPIIRPYYDQRYWIADTLSAMGYNNSSYFDQVRQYNNDLRQQYRADWAFTVFVVDSSNDSDNRFSDGFFAYAYLGGPFTVMTYGNNGYGPSYMNAVAAHEVGHIFGALDQYAGAGQACNRQGGYLGVQNQNSELGCLLNEASIMRGQIWPYLNRAVDSYARGQLGWQDSDGDNILDPVDVDIQVNDVSYVVANPAMPNILSFDGLVDEIPFPSPSGRPVLINQVAQVDYRVDGGLWFSTLASDGAFDNYREYFEFTTDPLPTGSHTVEVRVVDNFQNVLSRQVAQLSVSDPVEGRVETSINPSGQEGPVGRGTRSEFQGLASGVGYTVAAVQYRVDAGPWQSAQAQDGAFDSPTELFIFEVDTGPLAVGMHTIQARTLLEGGFADSSPATFSLQVETGGHYIYLPLASSQQ